MISLHRLRFAAVMAVLLVALGVLASSASAKSEHLGIGDAHAVAGAKDSGPGKRDLTVMTQNLYLGSSLTPALTATDAPSFVAAVAQIYATVLYTNFPARAEAIADEVKAQDPDLIGLQEVTKWTTQGENAPPGFDFLAILQADLASRGLDYSVAAVSDNADIGPAPLALPGCFEPPETFTCSVRLQDRDVILVNDDTPGLTWSNPKSGRYATQEIVNSPVGSLSFDRGWASIDARLKQQPFRFVTTHLETEDFPAVQEAQAGEFLKGPAKGGTIIATGDFNSAADGSTTDSYAQVTAPGKFRDAWDEDQLGPGLSCCQESNTPPLAPGALNNPVSTLRTRIDLILTRGAAKSDGAELIGDSPFEATPPLWPSDHAGVVAQLRLNG
jgi:endonuclease/exonuclease/phosphatase family metal-dependent hydrolase